MGKVIAEVGHSVKGQSLEAGREAATELAEKLGNEPDALIVFGACSFDHQELLRGISGVFPATPLVGGSTAGEITTSGFATNSVVIMGIKSDDLEFNSGISNGMRKDEKACAMELAKKIKQEGEERAMSSLLVFPDGMGGDGVKAIEGLQSVLGKEFEIVGGYLGDDENFGTTYQYCDGKVYTDAIVGLLINGDSEFTTGIGVRSGFESIGNRFWCTEADGAVVKKFDDEPALALYKQFLGEKKSEGLPGVCLEYPFGMIDEAVSISGKEYFQLRCGLGVDHESQTITLAASIPEGRAVTLTTASRNDIICGARLAAEQAKQVLGGKKPKAVLMFSCVGRKLVLGRRTQQEVEAVKEVLGNDAPISGFYTYGEIGPIDKTKSELSAAKFHNETVVLWVLGGN